MYTINSPSFFVPCDFRSAAASHNTLETVIEALSPLFNSRTSVQSHLSLMPTSKPSSSYGGAEQRVPSFQTFIKTVPANPQKSLPPDPPVTISQENQLKRSSSVYTRATGLWGTEKSWYAEPIVPTRPRSVRGSYSSSRPHSTLESPLTPLSPEVNPIPAILEPRVYAPLLPSPSPSLAPASERNSYDSRIFIQISSLDHDLRDTSYLENPLLLLPAPAPSFPGFSQSSFDLSSPTVATPHTLPRPHSTSPIRLSSRLSRPFDPSVKHRRDASMKKALASLGVTAEEAGILQRRHSKNKFPPRSLEYTRKPQHIFGYPQC
jgi:hypothetical protein